MVGIKDRIGTHTLRKTFGYHAYKMGMDLSVIQKLLNHASPSITLSYIGITRDDLDNVYLSLNLCKKTIKANPGAWGKQVINVR